MCICGDMQCWSCGQAQGNNKCFICGRWDDEGGCKRPELCREEMIALEKQDQEQEEELT